MDIWTFLTNQEWLIKILAPIFLLGVLVFIHELGHFLFAKLFKVNVERFSIGFGPPIISFKRKETEYCVALIPLGGYVKMLGDDPYEEDPLKTDNAGSFSKKPVWQRFLISFAGPLFNLLLPILLFTSIYLKGAPEPTSWVGMVLPNSSAELAGIHVGDVIVSVNNKQVSQFEQIKDILSTVPLGSNISIGIKRNDKIETINAKLNVEDSVNAWGERSSSNSLGVAPAGVRPVIFVSSSKYSSAYNQGLRTGDEILEINNKKIFWWYEVSHLLYNYDYSKPLMIKIKRDNFEKEYTLSPISGWELMLPNEVTSDLSSNNTNLQSNATIKNSAETSLSTPVATFLSNHPVAKLGIFSAENLVKEVVLGKPAHSAGILSGDMILAIDNNVISKWIDLKKIIEVSANKEKTFLILRKDKIISLKVKPAVATVRDAYGNSHEEGQVGIVPSDVYKMDEKIVSLGFITALSKGIHETWTITYVSVKLLFQVVTGSLPLTESLGGPIAIVSIAAQSAWISIFHYIRVMAFISISLGTVNLLPIPVLDGGHIFMYFLELVRGRPVGLRFREVSQQIGVAILFVLMAFAFANDIRMTFFK